MGYWNRIASVQKSKIVSCHSGQQIDLRSFFPYISGNWMVVGQVGSVFSNSRWVSGIRAVVEDLGNYNYRGWVQCSNSFLAVQFGTIKAGTLDYITNDWRIIAPNETQHIGFHGDIRCRIFGWTIATLGESIVNAEGRMILRDDRGDVYNNYYNSSNHHMNVIESVSVPYNSNIWVINSGNHYAKYYLSLFRTRWENCEGIVNLFITETRY